MQLALAIPQTQPRNESAQHWWLKHCARGWLRPQQIDAVGIEVPYPTWRKPAFYERLSAEVGASCCLHRMTGYIDVVGLGKRHYMTGRSSRFRLYSPEGDELVSVGIEVKVSRGDFLSGYHTACQYNYVLVPPGIAAVEELPDDVGLLCYDPSRYAPRNHKWAWPYRGWIRMERRAIERRVCPLNGTAAGYQIAYALTTEVLRNGRVVGDHPFTEDQEA